MKRIPLTQGKYAIVDNEDFEQLSKHKWHAQWNRDTQSFYAMRHSKRENGKQSTVSMAREILGLNKSDKREADHEDHNTLDNRKANLRIVTHQQNSWNQKNSKGYSWHKTCKAYTSRIGLNGKTVYLGSFKTAKEAHNVYLEAKKLYQS